MDTSYWQYPKYRKYRHDLKPCLDVNRELAIDMLKFLSA